MHSRTAGVFRAAWGWRHDPLLKRRVGNVAQLLAGNVASTMLALIAFALTAGALGPLEYGVLALITTYVRAIEQIVSFQSWQPLIKHGAALNAVDHPEDLRKLLEFGLPLDIAGSLAAFLLACAIILVAAYIFNWEGHTTAAVLTYCTVLLLRVQGTPTAIIRMVGRYRSLAISDALVSCLRLILCTIGFALGQGLPYFVVIWAVSQAAASMLMIILAAREIREQGLVGILRTPVRGVTQKFSGLWSFVWSTNLSLTIRSSAQQLDTFLVGALAGPSPAGLYHIAKRVGRLAQQVGVQVQAVTYPDIARLWEKRAVPEFNRAILQVEVLLLALAACVIVVVFVAGKNIIQVFAGAEFQRAVPLLMVQTVAVTLTLSSSALRPALLAMGRQNDVPKIVSAGTVAFYCTALVSIPYFGAMGANSAHIVLGLCVLMGMISVFRRASNAALIES